MEGALRKTTTIFFGKCVGGVTQDSIDLLYIIRTAEVGEGGFKKNNTDLLYITGSRFYLKIEDDELIFNVRPSVVSLPFKGQGTQLVIVKWFINGQQLHWL